MDEVEIVAEKADPGANIKIHSNLVNNYIIDEESPEFVDIFEMLSYAIPSLDPNTQDLIRFSRNTEGCLIVINQMRILNPADGGVIDYLVNIRPEDVLKIEYDASAISLMMFGDPGKNGAIFIYTKSNADYAPKQSKLDLQSVKQQIEGYYEARIFYSPDLEKVVRKNNNETIRNTLYWNPYIHPDQTGTSEVVYYNSAVETNVKVSLEGITATGIPVVVKTNYTIE